MRTAWAGGLDLVVLLALLKLLIHLATTGAFGYGFFIDELYFLACGQHLAWGYVDMPPLFPALTAAVRASLGDSLLAVRLVPALAGAGLVLLTGVMARRLGGGRFACGLAALSVVTAPIYLIMNSIHTMNALDPLFWMGCAALLIRLAQGGDERLWVLIGVLGGLGMNNKESMAFFAVAMAAGIVLTPLRGALARRWIWLGGALAAALWLPNLIWVVSHHFPHFQQLANIRMEGRDVALGPLQFLLQQMFALNPLAAPIWLAGLAWFLAGKDGRRYRVLGIAFVALMVEMLVLHGRVYYPAPAYPMLLAGGAVALERWSAARGRRVLRAAYAAVLVLAGAILAPFSLPCLPPQTFVRYARLTHLNQPRIENHRLGPLPQLLADRFGWPEMAAEVARIYHSLPPADRARAAIFAQNYGQAGAIDLFGPRLGLPNAISGHLTYWYWGARGATGDVVIVLDDNRATLERLFGDVELAGHVHHPYAMPSESFDIYVCRQPRVSLAELWPRLRTWD